MNRFLYSFIILVYIFNSLVYAAWTEHSYGTSYDLKSIIYDGNKYVTVGTDGLVLVSSNNGTTWTNNGSSGGILYGVASDGTIYVGVGSSGEIFISSDAQTWTENTSGVPDNADWTLQGVDANGSLFITGFDNTGKLLTSSDSGITWTERTATGFGNLYDITHNDSIFVAIDADAHVATSSDGITWSVQDIGTSTSYAVTYGDGKFVVVGGGEIKYSLDGTTWIGTNYILGSPLYGVAYNGVRFMAIGMNGVNVTSIDGITWSELPTITATKNDLLDIASNGEQFIAIGTDGAVHEWNEPKLTLKAHGGTVQFPNGQIVIDNIFGGNDNLDYTVETWVQITGTYSNIFNFGYADTSLSINDLGQIDFSGAEGLFQTVSDANISDNQWHHIAISYSNDRNISNIYIDGSLDKNQTGETSFQGNLTIGGDAVLIDEVRIWNTERTPTQISNNKNQQLEGNESGLIAYYNFDERV